MHASSIGHLVLGVLLLLDAQVRAETYPPAEPVTSLSPAFDRCEAMKNRVRELRRERDTAGLEAVAGELRANKDSLDGGTWFLTHFYRTAVGVPDEEPAASDAMAFYEAWAKDRPDNITAQICLADALVTQAWNARGGGSADTVTPEGWEVMQERLDRAWSVLKRARDLEPMCPGWFEVAQNVALGQGWGRDGYFALVDEAIEREPTYGKYYTGVCYWLLPRWHGETGDFEAWIAGQADRYPEDQRDEQYARLVWMADRMPVGGEIVFAPERLDWPRARRGFESWLARDPDNLNVRFQFTRLALLADDRETARAQFEITGGKYAPSGWRNPREFEQARQFAYEGGLNPLKMEKRDLQRIISPQAQQTLAKVFRYAAGLIGGTIAGLCLLWLALQRCSLPAGLAALFASMLLGTAFGTLATLIPAAILYLFLRRKHLVHPPPVAATRGWIIALVVIGLSVFSMALQIGAMTFALVPALLKTGPDGVEEATLGLMRDGTIYQQIAMAAWLTLLLLLAVCKPQNPEGWRRKLGLQPCRLGPTLLWMGVAALLLGGASMGLEVLMDERSREALRFMAEGRHSPFWFFATIVLIIPAMEELLFRGYAFGGWIHKIGPWGAIGLPAAIFTLCHVQYGLSGLAYVLAIGLLLGALRWKTGSTYPCLALHMLNNLAAAVMMTNE
jgi:membrane protease YdiL (CAAX protease family)